MNKASVILLQLTGFILLISGIVVLVLYNEYNTLLTSRFFTLPSFAIATGVIIILTTVLGFYGAISEQFYFIAGVSFLTYVPYLHCNLYVGIMYDVWR